MGVDIASMLAGSAVRVGKWIQGYLYLSEPSNVLYEAQCTPRPYSTFDLKMDRGPSECGNRIRGEEELIGAASIAVPRVGDDAVIRAYRDRFSGQPQEREHSGPEREAWDRPPPARYSVFVFWGSAHGAGVEVDKE